ncbi:hypothetical protein [Chryseobacterium vrystaatense]|uniref:Lipoprotein n=1 Tax=Chryseobacterium vrystaatense TaxID=307480 RepID=A0ABR4USJ1_9FLAO|nr:hypothetical protein [Chryseobacterium vrystaatense]KFF28169.1 hypothetical protein IW16_02840 [Chryseobacterium vrystaatense]
MKKFLISIILLLLVGCSKSDTSFKVIDKKDITIDSLKAELMDCKLQAKIMADILEKERIEIQNKNIDK